MNPELPEAIRRALTPKETASNHPSADLLTAFAEQTLSSGEKELVAAHVAACSECRDALFFASNAEDEPAISLEEPTPTLWKPRPKWIALVVKTLFAASGLIIVAGIFLRLYLDHENAKYQATQVAQVTPQQPLAAAKPDAALPPASTAQTPPTAHVPGAKPPGLKPKSQPAESTELSEPPKSPAPEVAEAKPVNPPSAINGGELTAEAVAPSGNAFQDSVAHGKAQRFASAPLAKQAGAYMRPQVVGKVWRITTEGELEHLSQSGWIRALPDRSTKFHALCEAPNGIWAGGRGAELFHSNDAGMHWEQIALPVPPDQVNDPIVDIRFNDLLRGSVTTKTGSRYITTDGGKQWQKE